MSKLATLMVAVGALALAIVTLSPSSAEAHRRWGRGWGGWGPGVNVYVGPRWGNYGYRYYRPHRYYGYRGYPYAYYPYWRRSWHRGWY
jgi:hypothetical protein